MPLRFLQGFAARLRERIYALLWGTVASDVETDALLHHVEHLDRIEEQARRYEDQDKTHLAELLRRRAASISPDVPAGTALGAIADLSGDRDVRQLELSPTDPPEPCEPAEPPALPENNGQRRRRSRCRRSGTKPKQ